MPAAAHPGRPVAPHDVWGAWSGEPLVIAGLFAAAWLYARGVERMWRRAGAGRGIRRWEARCFAGGWALLALALLSPLHALGETLFAAHMLQHTLLVGVAAPLLVLGRPLLPAVFALPPRARSAAGRWTRRRGVRRAWGALVHPLGAFALQAAVLWTWHLPALYGASLRSEWVHAAQHATFLLTALAFWWSVLHARGERAGRGAAVASLFGTTAHTGLLGAVLALAPAAWYPAYTAAATGAWGLTPLEDQQLAGIIMWVPAGFAYIAAGLWVFAAWLRESEARVRRREAVWVRG